jgi:aspartyl-tRNA(Asn)/glutamyl-tRNA(Gln) amidotransferase subunit C
MTCWGVAAVNVSLTVIRLPPALVSGAQKTLVPFRRKEEHLPLMADTPSESIDVTYVADLARLRLSPEEIATFQKQLGDVLGYVSALNEVDVSHVSLLGEANLKNRLRADVVQPSLPVAEALANAPKQDNNLIVVPRMIE